MDRPSEVHARSAPAWCSPQTALRQRWAAPPWLWMFAVGLLLRLALIVYLQAYHFPTPADGSSPVALGQGFNFNFGWESGAIADSLARGKGFSSPFGGDTGPTAWIAPLYPALCALVFQTFGAYSDASGFVILSLNSLFSALTVIVLWHIAERLYDRHVACWTGWLWSAGVIFMRWPVTVVWDTAASALLLALALLQSLRIAAGPSPMARGEANRGLTQWVLFAVIWAVAALTNPALLTVLPLSALWLAYQLRAGGQRWLRHAALAALLFVALISPWLVRNRVMLGQWVFLRDNAGFEIHLGNYHLSNGLGWYGKHPSQNFTVNTEYRQMGELAFIEHYRRQAREFIGQYPREFLQLVWLRFKTFWDGTYLNFVSDGGWRPSSYWPLSLLAGLGMLLTLERRTRSGWLMAATLVLYPVPYYLAFPAHRYRHPIEPELLLLSAFLVVTVLRRCGILATEVSRDPAIIIEVPARPERPATKPTAEVICPPVSSLEVSRPER